MRKGRKELIVVGDRVLVEPEEGDARTDVGLYLPKAAVEKESVQGGRIVAKGPGTPLPGPNDVPEDEPWKAAPTRPDVRYLPMQAEVGDFAIFFRRAAVEITFENVKYLIVPQAAILVLVRESVPPAPAPGA
jgi:co-chaperonin GroES (HSP10)